MTTLDGVPVLQQRLPLNGERYCQRCGKQIKSGTYGSACAKIVAVEKMGYHIVKKINPRRIKIEANLTLKEYEAITKSKLRKSKGYCDSCYYIDSGLCQLCKDGSRYTEGK